MDRDINYLLQKYTTKQPGEKWNKNHETEEKREYRLKQKIRLLDTLPINLQGEQKDRAKHLITKLNFNNICPKCSNEQIIIMISTVVKFEYNHNYRYSYCEKLHQTYGISTNLFIKFCIKYSQQ